MEIDISQFDLGCSYFIKILYNNDNRINFSTVIPGELFKVTTVLQAANAKSFWQYH